MLLLFSKPHPLTFGLLFFICGIYSAAHNYIIVNILISILLIFLVKRSITRTLLLSSFFLLGAFLYQRKIVHFQKFFEIIKPDKKYNLQGTITSLQELKGKRCAYYCILKNATISHPDFQGVFYKQCSLGIYCNNLQNFELDDVVYFNSATFKKPDSVSYQQHLCKEGVFATTFLSPEIMPVLMLRPQSSLKRWIFNKRKSIIYSLQKKMLPKTYTFFSSLFLGYKNNNYHFQQLKEHFKRWGLSHYLARSGLHLILFIALWQLLFRGIALPFALKHIFISIMVFLYYLLSWSSVPFTRSCLTYFGYIVCTLFDRQIDSLHILTLVIWSILLLNPMHLFALDFQLSFGLTFALIWFSQNKLSF